MSALTRGRWPLLAGLAAALVVLAIFAIADPDASGGRPLGIVLDGWTIALAVLALTLLAQLLLNARISLRRERLLVENSAELLEGTARLEALATTDTLTGMLNRRAFADRLAVELRRSIRYRRPVALLMIDLDHFKRVNDEHGHLYGDFVLAGAADTIRTNLRQSDVVARYGGEEFVAMLPETEQDAAITVAEKLRSAVGGRDFSRDGTTVRLTISIGVAAPADVRSERRRRPHQPRRRGDVRGEAGRARSRRRGLGGAGRARGRARRPLAGRRYGESNGASSREQACRAGQLQ